MDASFWLERWEQSRIGFHQQDVNPLLVQHWDEEWSRLWWVRADGLATVTDEPATVARAVAALRAKYQQYQQVPLGPPVIEVRITGWRGWPDPA